MYINTDQHLGEKKQLWPIQQCTEKYKATDILNDKSWNPFQNICSKKPEMCNAALSALEEVEKLNYFKDLYLAFSNAVANSSLQLVNADKIIVVYNNSGKNELDPMFQKLFKQTLTEFTKEIITKNIALFFKVYDYLLMLNDVLGMEKRRKLVSNQKGSQRAEADQFKLRFFINLYVAQNYPLADRFKSSWRIEKTYLKFENSLGKLMKFQNIEENLKLNQPINRVPGPAMWAPKI